MLLMVGCNGNDRNHVHVRRFVIMTYVFVSKHSECKRDVGTIGGAASRRVSYRIVKAANHYCPATPALLILQLVATFASRCPERLWTYMDLNQPPETPMN